MYEAERKRNFFVNSHLGGRALSALMLPWFGLNPPAGYGVLTTTGRRTGKARSRCVRAVRRGEVAYIVAIKGPGTWWLGNLRANPEVRLRIRGGTYAGVARELRGAEERREAMEAYCEAASPFVEFFEYMNWQRGRPTRSKIKQLHRTWFEEGTPVVVELAGS